MALNALKRDKIKDSRYAILSVCVGHVEILENDKKARLPWSLKNGGNGARGILADMPPGGGLPYETDGDARRKF